MYIKDNILFTLTINLKKSLFYITKEVLESYIEI